VHYDLIYLDPYTKHQGIHILVIRKITVVFAIIVSHCIVSLKKLFKLVLVTSPDDSFTKSFRYSSPRGMPQKTAIKARFAKLLGDILNHFSATISGVRLYHSWDGVRLAKWGGVLARYEQANVTYVLYDPSKRPSRRALKGPEIDLGNLSTITSRKFCDWSTMRTNAS
jgi:hypothetical protein